MGGVVNSSPHLGGNSLAPSIRTARVPSLCPISHCLYTHYTTAIDEIDDDNAEKHTDSSKERNKEVVSLMTDFIRGNSLYCSDDTVPICSQDLGYGEIEGTAPIAEFSTEIGPMEQGMDAATPAPDT